MAAETVAEYIDRLAFWTASTKRPSRWMSLKSIDRRKHLERIKARANDLSELLECGNGPEWPTAIELFFLSLRAKA